MIREAQQLRYRFVNVAIQHRNLVQEKYRHSDKGADLFVLMLREIQFALVGRAEGEEIVQRRRSSRDPIDVPRGMAHSRGAFVCTSATP